MKGIFFSFRFWLGERLYGVIGDPKFPVGYRVCSKRVVKWPCETPELDGHLFASPITSIPVPRVYKVHT
jgi:hypothetical protein